MSKEKRKKTSIKAEKSVGEHAYELQKKSDQKINPIELQQAIHKGKGDGESFESQIFECIDRGRKIYEKDFFVVVLFKKERALQNVIRQYFIPTLSCPTPQYDQVVYKYFFKEDRLEFIWVIPDQETCLNIPLFDNFLPEEQKTLIQFARDFKNGLLDKKCALLNGENVA